MYDGYIEESDYRKNLVNILKRTKYENLKNICRKLEYAISPYELIRFAESYKKGNKKLNDKIEYILTDCNFHSECSLLVIGKADELIEISKKEIEEFVMNEVKNVFIKDYLNDSNSFISANSYLLDNFSMQELFFCVDKKIIQKRDCAELAFELTQKEKNKIIDNSVKENLEGDLYEM